MIRVLFRWLFRHVSRVLRKTPLRRVRWLTHQHDRMFGLMWDSTMLHLEDFVLHTDPRDRNIAKRLALYGEYENYVQELLVSLAVPGSIAVDVGANIGLHTVPLSRRVGVNGRVIAFEPDPDNYQILLRNIRTNGLLNVSAHRLALSSESGTALLYQSWENRAGLSLRQGNVDNWGPQMDPVPVETVIGDAFLVDLDKLISLVKIDVEGAEPLVLQGMQKTLCRHPAIKILFEFWPHYVRSFNVDPLAFLTQVERGGFCLAIVDAKARCIRVASSKEIVSRGEASDMALNVLAARY